MVAATDVDPLPSCLVTEGVHDAELVKVRRFGNSYGPRIGLEFELLPGGERLLVSASPSTNPRGKFAELLRGLLGRDPTAAELGGNHAALYGMRCKLLARTETNRSGRTYSNVAAVFPIAQESSVLSQEYVVSADGLPD